MKLVRDTISRDVREAADLLYEGVQRGSISGVAFACTLKGGRRYFVNVAGTMATDPTLALGIVAALADELTGMVRAQAHDNTTLRPPI